MTGGPAPDTPTADGSPPGGETGAPASAVDAELAELRAASAERERRLWDLESAIPAAVSRTALLRAMLGDLRRMMPGRRRPA